MTICLIIMGTIDMDVGVLLAGGVGSRFWPLSKKNRPKQFMCNFNGKTFLKCAYERLEKVFGSKPHAQLVVTNEKYVDLINTDLPDVLILPENKSRNTAPAIAFAVAKALTMGANRMIVVPADHAFEREEIMVNALKKALDFVEKVPLLVVFGAKPLYPHTGYGYIKVGGSVDVEKFGEIKFVRRFFEKPSLERAKLYVNSGEYLWNMGIFVWSVEAVLKAFEDELPDYHEVILKIADLMSKGNGNFEDFNYELEKLEPFSIDIGLIERVRNIAVIPVEDCGWSDIGNLKVWIELVESTHDKQQNHICLDCEDTNVFTDQGLVVTVGVKNLIVVKKDDVVLICDKDRVNDVGKIPGILVEKGLDQYI